MYIHTLSFVCDSAIFSNLSIFVENLICVAGFIVSLSVIIIFKMNIKNATMR